MGSDSINISLTVLLSLTIFFFFTEPTLSADSPSSPPPTSPPSPSPAPVSRPSPSPAPISPSTFNSPPAPPPADLAPTSPPPGDEEDSPSPSPAPVGVNASHVSAETNASDLEPFDDEDGGMSGGQKFGVAFAVIAGACVVGLGALVYKKRQQNIQRAQYGYAARRELL